MESKFLHDKLTLDILKQIEDAIVRLQERTSMIRCVDDFLLSPSGMEKLDATCMLLIAIGESLKNFDKLTNKEILCTDDSIPRKDIMGVRDIIAHHYFDVDAEEIFNIIDTQLDPLLVSIKSFIERMS